MNKVRGKATHGKVKPFFYNYLLNGGWSWQLRHPLKTLDSLYRLFRAACQRAIWGWADMDIYSLDTHLAMILPPMLRRLATGNSYSPFIQIGGVDVTCEGAEEELYGALLESCAQAFDNYLYERSLTALPDNGTDDEWEHHWETERQATMGVQIALKLLADNFPLLWD